MTFMLVGNTRTTPQLVENKMVAMATPAEQRDH